MKVRNLVGDRFKERPADCVIDSHALMVKGGYIKYVANGIYSLFPPAKRITKKIENIIREEMDKIDGQEVLFPVALPATLWDESGRYESVGDELLRFQDRNKSRMVLGMTHEEAAVQLVRDYAKTYARYPFMIYQIQTKFRDEARPRAGLIRVREFTMKDAYSFHTSQEDLEEYYQRCYDAYHRIFARCGIPETVAVKSDSGMMGGNVSHEYMLLTPCGEDSIAICSECGYKANMEAADSIIDNAGAAPMTDLKKISTPNVSSIEDLCKFAGCKPSDTCKAVVYQKNNDDCYVIIFIRGDLDVNESKLTKLVKDNVHAAVITEESGIVAGFIGPKGLPSHVQVIYDSSLVGLNSLVTGANEKDFHFTGFNIEREVGKVDYVDVAKIIDGGICPCCGKKTITISRGIEVGNIFQLGTKYSKTMNLTYTDENGESHYAIMGCYGIGVGRLAASVAEVRHDDYGPIWPMSIAPWEVQLCCLRADDAEAKATADKLYEELQADGLEVIYDDRDIRPGVMFADADLLGVPVRVIVSPRNLAEGVAELVTRDKSVSKKVAIADIKAEVKALVAELYAKCKA